MDTVEKGVAMAVDYMEEWCERETERDTERRDRQKPSAEGI